MKPQFRPTSPGPISAPDLIDQTYPPLSGQIEASQSQFKDILRISTEQLLERSPLTPSRTGVFRTLESFIQSSEGPDQFDYDHLLEHEKVEDSEDINDPFSSLFSDYEAPTFLGNPAAFDLHDTGLTLAHIFQNTIKPTIDTVINAFGGEDYLGEFVWREKQYESIIAKLEKKMQAGIKVNTFEEAETVVYDGIGIKLILEDTSAEGIERFVESLIHAIESERIFISRLRNYHGKDLPAYLTQEQIERINEVHDDVYLKTFKVIDGVEAEKSSGYTSVQFDCQAYVEIIKDSRYDEDSFRQWINFDLHVRSEVLDCVAEAEHLAYKLRENGRLPEQYENVPELVDFANEFKEAPEEQSRMYLKYLRAYYLYARCEELGIEAERPATPIGFNNPNFDLLQLASTLKKHKP